MKVIAINRKSKLEKLEYRVKILENRFKNIETKNNCNLN